MCSPHARLGGNPTRNLGSHYQIVDILQTPERNRRSNHQHGGPLREWGPRVNHHIYKPADRWRVDFGGLEVTRAPKSLLTAEALLLLMICAVARGQTTNVSLSGTAALSGNAALGGSSAPAGFFPNFLNGSTSVNLIADPWLLPITSICNTATPPTCSGTANTGTVEVTTASPHGLSNGQVVNISGVYDSTGSSTQNKNAQWNTFGGANLGQNVAYGGGVTITVDDATHFHYSMSVNSAANVTTSGQTGFVVTQFAPKLNQVFTDPVFGERTVRATCPDMEAKTWPASGSSSTNSACGPNGNNPFSDFATNGNAASRNWSTDSAAMTTEWGIYCPPSGMNCANPGTYNLWVLEQSGWNGGNVAGGSIVPMSFNPATMQVSPYSWGSLGFAVNQPPGGSSPWSKVDPDVLYYVYGGQVLSRNLRIHVQSVVFNPASACGPSNAGPPGWDSGFALYGVLWVGYGDQALEIAGGGINSGGPEMRTLTQDLANFSFVYTAAPGKTLGQDPPTQTCYWWNLNTSQYGTYSSSTGATGPFNLTDPRTGKRVAQTAAPPAFTPTATAGGSLPDGGYVVQTTYTKHYSTNFGSYGESLPSPEASVTLGSGHNVISVSSPPPTPRYDSTCGSVGCAYDQVVATGYKVYLGTTTGTEVDVTARVFGPTVTLLQTTGGSLANGYYGIKLSYLTNQNGSTQAESDGTRTVMCIQITGSNNAISVPEPTQVPTEVNWKIYAANVTSGTCSSPTYGTFYISSTNAVGSGVQVVGSIPSSGANPRGEGQNQTGPVALGTNWSSPTSWTSVPSGSYDKSVFYNAQHSSGADQTPGHPPTIGTSGFTAHACGEGTGLKYIKCSSSTAFTSPDNVIGNAYPFDVYWHYTTDPTKAEMDNIVYGPDGTVATAGGGHPAQGFNYNFINISTSSETYAYYKKNMEDLSVVALNTPPPVSPNQCADMHQGGTFTPADNTPFVFDGELVNGDDRTLSNCRGTYNSGWSLSPTRAWDNEVVLCSTTVAPDPNAGKCWRFAKDRGGSFGSIMTTAGWLSSAFGVSVLPICNLSQDARYAACGADWYGTLPALSMAPPTNSVQPGRDVFIYELK